jgi:acetyl-CoA C-acetyltransferase
VSADAAVRQGLDPRTPVLVGVAAVEQREEDPDRALEPVELMARALEQAGDDAGSRAWLEDADAIFVPRGMWAYPDPGRLLAEAIGAQRARSVFFQVGILQTTLFGRAAAAIAAGDAEVVLVAGGEAKYRAQRASIAGTTPRMTDQSGASPDEVVVPAADILHPLELQHGLGSPVSQYAIMENALRYAQGLEVEEHRSDVAAMWSAFSEVAAGNPHAWRRERVAPEEIAQPGPGNRMLAFPYTKLHNSQWNVDQAGALVFCSYARARAAGVPEERLIFARSVTESNHMLPLVERANVHRAPASGIGGRRAFEIAGLAVDDVTHRELYSCFPSAVRIQASELGLPLSPPPTESGGMAFAGGPLNNFVIQALVRMVEVLRADPDSHGLVTAVSGLLTKIGASVWSTLPGLNAFAFEDVAKQVAEETTVVPVDSEATGAASVASYTVLYDVQETGRGVALCDLQDGRRTIASTNDADVCAAMTREEFCGRDVRVRDGGVLDAG